MDRSTAIKLISEAYAEDEYGVMQPVLKKRKVFANVQSVSRTEWFEGGRSGLNPEFKMTVFGPDYKGEQAVEYNGQTYDVYRTYAAKTDTLELYVQRKQGKR